VTCLFEGTQAQALVASFFVCFRVCVCVCVCVFVCVCVREREIKRK